MDGSLARELLAAARRPPRSAAGRPAQSSAQRLAQQEIENGMAEMERERDASGSVEKAEGLAAEEGAGGKMAAQCVCGDGERVFWACARRGAAGTLAVDENGAARAEAMWATGLGRVVGIACRAGDPCLYVLEAGDKRGHGRLRKVDCDGTWFNLLGRLAEPSAVTICGPSGAIHVLDAREDGARGKRLVSLDGELAQRAMAGPNPLLRRHSEAVTTLSFTSMDVCALDDGRVAIAHRAGRVQVWNPVAKAFDFEVQTDVTGVVSGGLSLVPRELQFEACETAASQLVLCGTRENQWKCSACLLSVAEMAVDEGGCALLIGNELCAYSGPFSFGSALPCARTLLVGKAPRDGRRRCLRLSPSGGLSLVGLGDLAPFRARGPASASDDCAASDDVAVRVIVCPASQYLRSKSQPSPAALRRHQQRVARRGARVQAGGTTISVAGHDSFHLTGAVASLECSPKEILSLAGLPSRLHEAVAAGRDLCVFAVGHPDAAAGGHLQMVLEECLEEMLGHVVLLNVEIEALWHEGPEASRGGLAAATQDLLPAAPRSLKAVAMRLRRAGSAERRARGARHAPEWRRQSATVDSLDAVRDMLADSDVGPAGMAGPVRYLRRVSATFAGARFSFAHVYGVGLEATAVALSQITGQPLKAAQDLPRPALAAARKEACAAVTSMFDGTQDVIFLACFEELGAIERTCGTLRLAQVAAAVPKRAPARALAKPDPVVPETRGPNDMPQTRQCAPDWPQFSYVPVRRRPASARRPSQRSLGRPRRTLHVQYQEWAQLVVLTPRDEGADDGNRRGGETEKRPAVKLSHRAQQAARALFASFDRAGAKVLADDALEALVLELERAGVLQDELESQSAGRKRCADKILSARGFELFFERLAAEDPAKASVLVRRAGFSLSLDRENENEESDAQGREHKADPPAPAIRAGSASPRAQDELEHKGPRRPQTAAPTRRRASVTLERAHPDHPFWSHVRVKPSTRRARRAFRA